MSVDVDHAVAGLFVLVALGSLGWAVLTKRWDLFR